MKLLRHSDYAYLALPIRYASFAIGGVQEGDKQIRLRDHCNRGGRAYELLPPRHSKQLNASLKGRLMMEIRRQVLATGRRLRP